MEVLVSVRFALVSALSEGDLVQVSIPGTVSEAQLWIRSVLAVPLGPVQLDGEWVSVRAPPAEPGDAVQLDAQVVFPTAETQVWQLRTVQTSSGLTLDAAYDVPGLQLAAPLVAASLEPADVEAGSYVNHLLVAFTLSTTTLPNATVRLTSPEGFSPFRETFRAGSLPGGSSCCSRFTADERSMEFVVRDAMNEGDPMAFYVTFRNPWVAPTYNWWQVRVQHVDTGSDQLASRIPGFLVVSKFNYTRLETEVTEPLAANFLHVAIAVGHALHADAFFGQVPCEPTVLAPVCPPLAEASLLEIRAPEGFRFPPTCGYWVLERIGGSHEGLPPGTVCSAGDASSAGDFRLGVARLRVARTLVPGTIYEFSVQVSNALAVPAANTWALAAREAGVSREHALVPGFELRTLPFFQVQPRTALANAVDNTVQIVLRSARPITRGAVLILVAPEGFRFDDTSAESSLQGAVTAESPAPQHGLSSIAMTLGVEDFVPPNTDLRLSVRVQNPAATPDPNFWSVDIRSAFAEHIDLARFVEGFAIAYMAPFVSIVPDAIPWERGSETEVAVLFVTTSPVFQAEVRDDGPVDAEWHLVLQAPFGFQFPTENKYTARCKSFARFGGKKTYGQLPRRGLYPESSQLSCAVQHARAVHISVPATLIAEQRWSFRLAVAAAEDPDGIAVSERWRLDILEEGQLRHTGRAPSPLVGVVYEPVWYYEM